MKNSNFVWTDLSTFDLDATKGFYEKIFGWQYHAEAGYHLGYVGDQQAAGVYVMPEKFQKMRMPSFWMSYILVTDINTVVEKAKQMGGIVEVKPTDFMGGGQISLIRDPSGAGFTVWEGPDLGGKDEGAQHGRMAWNELYVSDAALVLDFYKGVFGWSFTRDQSYAGERYDIYNGVGTAIAALEIIPNEIKGKHEFWVPYFAVKDMTQALQVVTHQGGEIVDQSDRGGTKLALVHDPQGAAFALTENPNSSSGYSKPQSNSGSAGSFWDRFKFLTLIAIVIIYLAVLFELSWVWGLLFLVWLVQDIRLGEVHLVETIYRSKNPVWYWLIIFTWFWMSGYLLLGLFTTV